MKTERALEQQNKLSWEIRTDTLQGRELSCAVLYVEQILPVAFPCVTYVGVINAMFVCLLIQEIKHVFDGQRKGTPSVDGTEQCLK